MRIIIAAILFSLCLSCNNETASGYKPQAASHNDSISPNDPASAASKLQPETRDTSPVTANLSAPLACLLTEISYCNALEDTAGKYLSGWKVIWNPASLGGNHAFLATDGNRYALAIRGSLISFTEDAFNNWILQDLNVGEQSPWPFSAKNGAMISAGSMLAWGNITAMKDRKGKTLIQMLDSLLQNDTPLLITGHSLGGNLATVVAVWIDAHFKKQNRVHPDINVMTFAAPAAGNQVFADDFNERFPHALRYENKFDIVPKFPVAEKVRELQGLYQAGPVADQIKVGYGFLKVSLSSVISGIQISLHGMAIRPGYSAYVQTNGNGTLLTLPLSGNNKDQNAVNWFAEAGYQHSAEQYAKALGVPVIHTQ